MPQKHTTEHQEPQLQQTAPSQSQLLNLRGNAVLNCGRGIKESKNMAIEFKKNEVYQELGIYVDGQKIGDAEIDIKNKMLSRLAIFEPHQNKGYGTVCFGKS